MKFWTELMTGLYLTRCKATVTEGGKKRRGGGPF